jgi:2'-5' RNA ligase
MSLNLKLIAIIPPEPLYSDIRNEQTYIAATWGPKRALRTPPHITIIPPMLLNPDEVGWLYGIAYAIAGTVAPFSIQLKNYSSFKPRVIFISPIVSPALSDLHSIWHQAIITRMPHVLAKYPDRPYHPHLTLAHKDVTHTQFDSMWKYYADKPYLASFNADRFCILTHTDDGWSVEKEYFFDLRS